MNRSSYKMVLTVCLRDIEYLGNVSLQKTGQL